MVLQKDPPGLVPLLDSVTVSVRAEKKSFGCEWDGAAKRDAHVTCSPEKTGPTMRSTHAENYRFKFQVPLAL